MALVASHVALVFPGRRYGLEMPVLRYPAHALAQLGAEVQAFEYPEFLVRADAPDDEQVREVTRAATEFVAQRVAGAARVTLLAKSLGTRIIARLPPDLVRAQVDAVWLTPIFVDAETVRGAMTKTSWRSPYVYGDADPSCNEAALRDIAGATGGGVLSITGGDHSLDVDGDVRASLDALVRLTAAVLDLARS